MSLFKTFMFITALLLVIFPITAEAGDLQYTSFYPSPIFSFSTIRFYPQSEIAEAQESCTDPGKLYFNEDANTLYTCHPLSSNPSQSIWDPLSAIWTQSGSNIILTDTSNPELKRVGIGTDQPFCKLTFIGPYSGINAGDNSLGSGPKVSTSGFGVGSTQFVWYPRKAALVAGSMGDQATLSNRVKRSDSQIGLYSTAFGIGTFATGESSAILAGQYAGIDSASTKTIVITAELPPDGATGSLISDSDSGTFSFLRNASTPAVTRGSAYSFIAMGGGGLNYSGYSVAFGYNTSSQALSSSDGSNYVLLGNNPTVSGTTVIGNDISGRTSSHSAIFSSSGQILNSQFAFIGNGTNNIIRNGMYNTIFSGEDNRIGPYTSGNPASVLPTDEFNSSVILSGSNNINIAADNAFIGGGQNNLILSQNSVILGGLNNSAGRYSSDKTLYQSATVAGGKENKAYAPYSFIGGGEGNRVGIDVDVYCGDGDKNTALEECDDGNSSNTDSCTNTCKNAVCGDGYTWAGVEDCDSGGGDSPTCNFDCTFADCGDTYVNTAAGEECDDGNSNNNDSCVNCQDAECLDGYVWTGVEDCEPSVPLTVDCSDVAAPLNYGTLSCASNCSYNTSQCRGPRCATPASDSTWCPNYNVGLSEDNQAVVYVLNGGCTGDPCEAYCPTGMNPDQTEGCVCRGLYVETSPGVCTCYYDCCLATDCDFATTGKEACTGAGTCYNWSNEYCAASSGIGYDCLSSTSVKIYIPGYINKTLTTEDCPDGPPTPDGPTTGVYYPYVYRGVGDYSACRIYNGSADNLTVTCESEWISLGCGLCDLFYYGTARELLVRDCYMIWTSGASAGEIAYIFLEKRCGPLATAPGDTCWGY